MGKHTLEQAMVDAAYQWALDQPVGKGSTALWPLSVQVCRNEDPEDWWGTDGPVRRTKAVAAHIHHERDWVCAVLANRTGKPTVYVREGVDVATVRVNR